MTKKKTTKNKGPFKYELDIRWSEEDQVYVARVPELKGCSSHGKTYVEAAENAQDAIAAYLEALRELGKPIPVPLAEESFSGKLIIRTNPEHHRDLMIQARMNKTSLNQYVVSKLKRAV